MYSWIRIWVGPSQPIYVNIKALLRCDTSFPKMSAPRAKMYLQVERETMRESVMVSQIDTAKLTTMLNAKADRDDLVGEQMVVANTVKGLATVCSDGVGWWKNDDGKYLVGAWVRYSNPTFYLTEDELLSCLSSEQVDLAEFVQTFGSRLENNFDLWYNQVKNVSQDISAFDFA